MKILILGIGPPFVEGVASRTAMRENPVRKTRPVGAFFQGRETVPCPLYDVYSARRSPRPFFLNEKNEVL